MSKFIITVENIEKAQHQKVRLNNYALFKFCIIICSRTHSGLVTSFYNSLITDTMTKANFQHRKLCFNFSTVFPHNA